MAAAEAGVYEDERLRRIVLLLTTQDDYLTPWSDPKTSTGQMVAASALPGPGPSERVDCPRCEAVGRVVGNARCAICWRGEEREHKCSECPTCHGERKVWIDGMTGEVIEAAPERRTSKQGGAKARRRGGSQRDLGDQAHAWERARARHEYATSRAALRRALELLRDHDVIAYGLVRACYIEQRYGNPDRPRCDEGSRHRIASGLLFLSEAMPDEIRLPLQLEEQLNGSRRASQARRLLAEGRPRREIARTMGVSRGHVAALLRRG